ncbi:MAG TPA: acyl-CoA dehydrogenase family protein [Myxococcota bacterium]|nr:acyl-CoA dehydrogenase family protein [Myxococcota bacterium]
MNFDDTPQEAEFRAKARAFLDKHLRKLDPSAPGGDEFERETKDDIARAKAWQATKFDAGWAVLTWPKEYGGQALGRLENVIFNQEEAKYHVPPNIYGIGHGMLGPTIMAHGTQAQKDRFIKEMARGQVIWCQLFSEPAAGSDLAGLRTTAVRDGNDWIINGQKIWSTGAHYSDWGMIVTRHDPNLPKHDGLTYFIVDMHAPGVEIRQIKQINGGAGFNEVFFTNVRVPDSQRLGGVGEGWKVAITTLMNERVSIGAGQGSGRVRDLFRLARKVKRGGKPAIQDSAVRQKLADYFVQSKGLQYTGYRTLSAISRGATPGPEGSIGKAVGAPLSQQMASFASELQGAAGGLLDPAAPDASWMEGYLASPGIRIAGGSDEIMRNIIAERVLGLPAEWRADKGIPFRDVPTGTVKAK